MIHCKQLSKRFGSAYALKELTLHIKKNTIVGLVGRNGAGKTTLLKLIAGCWRPTSGDITVLKERPFDNLFISTNSILIDDEMVFPEILSLGELLEVSANFYPNWDMTLAERLFAHFQFEKGVFYYQLSKGKKSTFNTIIGLCSRVSLTIFDEPTTGMDRSVREDFYKALLKDYINHPRTIIISSHHIDELEHLLEEVVLIDKGESLLHLPIDEVRNYARGVRGPEHEIRTWLKDKTVLHEESVGIDELFVIVKNDENMSDATDGTFTVTAISPAELAVYLTGGEKGGIDYVFN